MYKRQDSPVTLVDVASNDEIRLEFTNTNEDGVIDVTALATFALQPLD